MLFAVDNSLSSGSEACLERLKAYFYVIMGILSKYGRKCEEKGSHPSSCSISLRRKFIVKFGRSSSGFCCAGRHHCRFPLLFLLSFSLPLVSSQSIPFFSMCIGYMPDRMSAGRSKLSNNGQMEKREKNPRKAGLGLFKHRQREFRDSKPDSAMHRVKKSSSKGRRR